MNVQGAETLIQMMQGVLVSGIVKASVELDVYTKIAEGAGTVPAIAKEIGCPERSTRILLDALASLGLVTKASEEYALMPATAQFFVRGKPTYLGLLIQTFGGSRMWTSSQKLAAAVRRGCSVLPDYDETQRQPFWETFAQSGAYAPGAAAQALDTALATWCAERATVRVLDLAAGSGVYGFTLARRPNVHLTVLDFAYVLAESRHWAKRLQVDESRVRYIEGNLFEVDFGGPYDLVIASHIYQHFDAAKCASLTAKVGRALAPEGRLAVHDFLYNAALSEFRVGSSTLHAKSAGSALFAVTVLMWARNGEMYGIDDYARWFAEAKLRPAGVHASAGMPSSFLFADA